MRCAAPIGPPRTQKGSDQMKRVMVLFPLMALALSACSDMPRTWRQSEIEEIAANRAEDFADAGSAGVANELAGQINQLEQRIDELERENQGHKAMIDELYENQRRTAEYLRTFD